MSWVDVVELDRLVTDRGVAATVAGQFVAVFRLADDEVVAIDHVDPASGAPVLARGIVASVGERAVVASPLHRQRYDLHSGACLDDPALRVAVWPVQIVDGIVRIADAPASPDATTGSVRSTAPA